MNKSTITRERAEQLANFKGAPVTRQEEQELARIALAAMDSDPVEWLNGCNKSVPAALRYLAENPRPIGGESSFNTAHLYQLAREIELMAEGTLYRHAQPAVSKPWGYTSGILNPAVGMACVTPTRGKNQFPVYLDPQPEPVVPEERPSLNNGIVGFDEGWNACRAAMLQAEPVTTANKLGNSPVIPDTWIPVSERMPEFGDYLVTDGCDFDVQLFNGEEFIPGFVWEDKITHWMPLPKPPQEVKP